MTKKRGRPKGSKNRNYEPAMELPATCPSCGSTELTSAPGKVVIKRSIAGTIEGREYNAITWIDKKCACGQFVRVRRFEKKIISRAIDH